MVLQLCKHGSAAQAVVMLPVCPLLQALLHLLSCRHAYQTKTEERKAAALQARVAGMKQRVSTAVPRISRVFSPGSSRPSGEELSTAAAADTEEI